MCPVCWINGLIAFLVGMGLFAIDSPFTPFLIFMAVVLTTYGVWKLWQGYKKGKSFTSVERADNWNLIRRFTYGLIVGSLLTGTVFYIMDKDHHGEMHGVHEKHGH